METKKICKCCGKYELDKNSLYEVCPICGWESDSLQENNPNMCGGANELSLNKYKENYEKIENSLKSRILNFLDNFNAIEINEYFANDFVDDRENYMDKKEKQEVLEFLNDVFIDINVDFRDTNMFESKVLEALKTALKMIDEVDMDAITINDINECDKIKTKDGRTGTVMAKWFDTTGLEVEFEDTAPETETIDVADVIEIIR